MSRISQAQLESYLWGAAEHLRGSIDAGDYKQFIFPLLFLKRLCDVHDEETAQALRASGGDAQFASFAENHRFQVPAEAHWKEVRKETRNVGQAIQRAMRAIESANKDKLFGIFGDAQWSNKDRLSDETMRELVEHFSSLELTIGNLPEDELGNGYEFLIKKFADDSGHTAAEFYTNRTVVHLMTEMLDVQPGESVYDPTCGSGGMLMSCVAHLRKQGKEWRNVRLFGQERNLMTSSIARMNCFLHGIEDFRIERGDTLAEPKLVEGDKLMQFDVVLANPPYSIKQWDREAFRSDPWGRNLFGVPPQGRADYAFQQHINKSLKAKTGRCAVLWPHGVLVRHEDAEIRSKMLEADLIECIIGLGKNLFYNSAMDSCVMICRTHKPKERKGKILLIDASDLVTEERGQAFLSRLHIDQIRDSYLAWVEQAGFSKIVKLEDVRANKGNLNIPLYVQKSSALPEPQTSDSATATWDAYQSSSAEVRNSLESLLGIKHPESVTKHFSKNATWLDKSKWRKVKLDEVAFRDTAKVSPSIDNLTRWVGADHIDEDDVNVTRWAFTSDSLFPPTFKYTFKPGHVLLHSRNPNKVCVPRFNGITGEKLFILKPKDDSVLSADFLPFLLRTNKFKAWAKQWSSGSVNKFLNWSSLANYEFDLPPLDQQRRIAEILWAIDLLQVRMLNVELAARSFKSSQLANGPHRKCASTITEGSKAPQGIPLRDVAKIVGGAAFPHSHQGGSSSEIPFYKVSDMNRAGNEVHMSLSANYISESERLELGARLIPKGAVIFPKVGAALLTNKRRITAVDCCIDNNLMAVVPLKLPVDFLYEYLCGVDFASIVQPGALPSINQSQVDALTVPLLSTNELNVFLKSNVEANRLIATCTSACRACALMYNKTLYSLT